MGLEVRTGGQQQNGALLHPPAALPCIAALPSARKRPPSRGSPAPTRLPNLEHHVRTKRLLPADQQRPRLHIGGVLKRGGPARAALHHHRKEARLEQGGGARGGQRHAPLAGGRLGGHACGRRPGAVVVGGWAMEQSAGTGWALPTPALTQSQALTDG